MGTRAIGINAIRAGLLGDLDNFLRDPLGMISECHKKSDQVLKLRFLSRSVYFINDLSTIRGVLKQPASFARSEQYSALVPAIGDGLITMEGDTWRKHRLLFQKLFSSQALEEFSRVFRIEADNWAANRINLGNQESGSILVLPEMSLLTLRCVCQGLLGKMSQDDYEVVHQSWEALQKEIARLTWMPKAVRSIRGRFARRFIQSRRELYQVLDAHIEKALKHQGFSPFFDLVRSYEAAGNRLSADELRTSVLTFLIAGHETSASALGWCLHTLAQQHVEQDQIHETLRRSCSDSKESDDLITAFINETMRLYPPTWIISRQTVGEVSLGDHTLPAGSMMLISPYGMHRSEQHWAEPSRFKLQRFLGDPSSFRDRFMPFGFGPRVCIGQGFAMIEMLQILKSILTKFRISALPESDIKEDPAMILRFNDDYKVQLIPKREAYV
jgi:cytochrome P450